MKIVFWILGVVVFLILLAVLAVFFLNIHIYVTYDEKLKIDVRILFVHLNGLKILTSDLENPKKKKNKLITQEIPRQNGKIRGTPADFLDFLQLVTRVIRDTLLMALDRIHIRLRSLSFSFGMDDAAETALLYGTLLQAANALFALLDRFSHFSFDPEKVILTPDFSGGKPSGKLDLYIRMRVIDYIRVNLYFNTSYQEGKDGTL